MKKSVLAILGFAALAAASWQVASLRRGAAVASAPFDRIWTFEPPQYMEGIRIENGACSWSTNGGVDDSSCLAIADTHCGINFGVRADQLPVQIDFLVYPDEPNGFLLTSATWFDLDTYGQFDQYIGGTKLVAQQGWYPMRMYVSDRSVDVWCDGMRNKLAYMTAKANAELGLVTVGRCRIDHLTVHSIEQDALPHDLDDYLDAAERVEPERRKGFVTLLELGRADRPPPKIHYLVVQGRPDGSRK